MARTTPFTNFTTLDANLIAEIRAAHPGVPDDYLKFLHGTGYGTLGFLTVYSGLVEPSEIFGDIEHNMNRRYRAFADFNGDVIAAFDLKSWAVVEIDESRSISVTDETFSAFVDRWLVTLSDGSI